MFNFAFRALAPTPILWLVAFTWITASTQVVLADEDNAAEAKIHAALRSKTQFEFLETPLQDVVDFLGDFHKIKLRFDKIALEDVGVGTDVPVTRRLKGVSLRSALRLMLRDFELTYVIEDGVLLITTPEEAETRLSTTPYPVADLVNGDPETPYSPDNADFDPLIELIESTIAPDSWDANGGPGSMDGFGKAGVLVVSQTQSVHRQIAPLLATLHRLRGTPVELKAKKARKEARDKEVIVRVYRVTNVRGLAGGPSKDSTEGNAKAAEDKTNDESLPPDYAAAKRSADALAGLIRKAVLPKSWGKEHFVRAIPGTLTIRQSRRVHREIGRLLDKMDLLDGVATLSPVVRVAPPRDLPTSIRLGEIAGDARICQVLDDKTKFELIETPLSDFMKFLADKHKIEIQIDIKALEDVGIGADIPLTGNLKGISLRSALRLTLRDVELTFVVRDEVLMITTPEEAETTLLTWVYPVSDLVGNEEGEVEDVYAEIDFDPFIELIEATVAPDSWDANGGPGAIDGLENPTVIVVAQTRKIHEQIVRLITKLRQLRSSQFKRDDKARKAAASRPVVRVYRVFIGVDRTVKKAAKAKVAAKKVAAAPLGGAIGGNLNRVSRQPALERMEFLPDDASADRAMQDLVALVTGSIEPQSWNAEDGGMIYTMRGYLVVRQSAKVQRRVRALLHQTGVWQEYRTPDAGGTTGPPPGAGVGIF
ncbi:MAG: hypothetical protein IIA67_03005 [Planctomycetes bacterium]|nr:hypothetical protein [Planctomycetota bacterium]